MEFASAQDQLDSASPNAHVSLAGSDYGPLVIDRPLTLDCNGASVWAHSAAPSIRVRSPDVVLENAVLQAWDKPTDGSWPLVLEIEAKAGAHFRNVKLAGSVRGNGPESGPWIIPREIELGVVRGLPWFFILDFAVPVPCRLTSRVSGLDFDPPALSPGINTVRLTVTDASKDSILWGVVELSSDQFVRLIPLHGRVALISTSAERVSGMKNHEVVVESSEAAPGASPAAAAHLHKLTKKQETEFNQSLHPAPQPIAVGPTAITPLGKPPAKLLRKPPKLKLETHTQVLEQTPAHRGLLVRVVQLLATRARTLEAGRTEVDPAKRSPFSNIFFQPEPELPALVVQPELLATVDVGDLFQAGAVRETKPDEPSKPANPPAEIKRLLSKLFTQE